MISFWTWSLGWSLLRAVEEAGIPFAVRSSDPTFVSCPCMSAETVRSIRQQLGFLGRELDRVSQRLTALERDLELQDEETVSGVSFVLAGPNSSPASGDLWSVEAARVECWPVFRVCCSSGNQERAELVREGKD